MTAVVAVTSPEATPQPIRGSSRGGAPLARRPTSVAVENAAVPKKKALRVIRLLGFGTVCLPTLAPEGA